MNVGQLRELLEWVPDKTMIYVETTVVNTFEPATISLDFVVDSEHGDKWRQKADPDSDNVDSEVGLLVW